MSLDLHWLEAPDAEVAAAMATVRRESRPSWVPTRRQVLLHVNYSLLLWYLCIALMTIGIRVDGYGDGTVTPGDVTGLVTTLAILALWLGGTYLLHRWVARPPSPKSRLGEWRQILSALANGFEPQASPGATFSSVITLAGKGVREYPRFVAPGIEFGDLVGRAPRSTSWRYLAVTLPAPLPHLIIDATANDRLGGDLPAGIERGQRISLEGGFDRSFRVFAPAEYRTEALYVLTPDLMSALLDHSAHFNVEIVGRSLVFFAPSTADFARTESWAAIHALSTAVVPRILDKSRRYLDERVPGQEVPRMLAEYRFRQENPEVPWVPPEPRIGPDGRLRMRVHGTGRWSVVGAVGWFTVRTLLYAVPGIFAFAGFMSIVDGR